MVAIRASTKALLLQELSSRVQERWSQLTKVSVTCRGQYAYVEATDEHGQQVGLCRLRYVGYPRHWGLEIYRASHDDYVKASFPDGWRTGTPQDALDIACGLHFGDPIVWT